MSTVIRAKIISTFGNEHQRMPDDPLIGTTVVDRYEILSVIGFGGWSVVYRAFDKSLNRLVAIKAMHAHLCVDQTKLLRFQREAEASAGLTHPNIAVVYDNGLLWAGRPYISMELVEGESLAQSLNRGGAPDLEKTLAIFIQICNGLEAIHNPGLVHRDLKPGNIKVSTAGEVKILDFGCAKHILQENNLLTRTDESVGTPAYMSPEQCLGKPVDARSDIYSFGCVMYEVLTGRRPFQSENLLDCMRMHIKSMPAKFRVVQPSWKIPERLEAVVFKACAKDPGDRYASAKELRDALSTSLHDLSLKSRLSQPWHRLGVRRQQRILLSMFLLALLGGLGAVSLWQSLRSRSIVFPDGHEVGVLFIVGKDSSGKDTVRERLGAAEGTIRVPLNAYIQLAEIPETDAEKLSFLQKLGENDIQKIDLSGTSPRTEAIENIDRLAKLNILSLNSTTITDEALEKLRMSELVGLDLTGTSVSDRSLASVAAGCPKLHWVQLRGNARVTDQGIISLTRLPLLNALLLQDMPQITDECLIAVASAKAIKSLVLRGDRISDTGMAHLSDGAQLNTVDLSSTRITSNGVKSLAKLSSLRNLNLSETAIGDDCLTSIISMSALKTLNVASTSISPAGLRKLEASLPNCQIKSNQ
jgi:serine/threonine protein kinase